MSLVLHPSVHFVCIAQDMLLAENAHLTTRLGGSFGKQAFRAYQGAGRLTNSRRTWAAASANSQKKRKALIKGVLLERKTEKASKQRRPVSMSTASAIITTCTARERERKRRSNQMSLDEGTNH